MRVTDWDGEPIAFGDQIRYVCRRGYKFEDDPEQLDIKYTCQDGSDPKFEDRRGFFDIPTRDEDWPRCLLAPLCPEPPDAPEEGVKEFHPIPIPMELETVCSVNPDAVNLECHSFLNIYIGPVSYGRNKTKGKTLCDGEKIQDIKAPNTDCFDDSVNEQIWEELSLTCKGKSSCSYEIPTILLDSACDGMKREANIAYICGKLNHLDRINILIYFS